MSDLVRSGSEPGARPALWSGVVGGLIGATCCFGPAIGVAIGASTGSFLVGLGRYRFFAFAIGASLALGSLFLILRRRRSICPTEASFKALRSRWLDVTLIAFAATYVIGRFVVPWFIEQL